MNKYINNKGIFFGISSLNVLNTVVTKGVEINIKEDETNYTINIPQSYNDFKKNNGAACRAFGLTEEDYIRYFVGKHSYEKNKSFPYVIQYRYVKKGENNYEFYEKNEGKTSNYYQDHFYIENLLEICEQYEKGKDKAKKDLAEYMEYLLHPYKHTGVKKYYHYDDHTTGEVKYKGCYYQIAPSCSFVKNELNSSSNYLYCNEFDMIPIERRNIKVELEDNFFQDLYKVYLVEVENYFDTNNIKYEYKDKLMRLDSDKFKEGKINALDKTTDENFQNFRMIVNVKNNIDTHILNEKIKKYIELCKEYLDYHPSCTCKKEEKANKEKEIKDKKERLLKARAEFEKNEENDICVEKFVNFLKEQEVIITRQGHNFSFKALDEKLNKNIEIKIEDTLEIVIENDFIDTNMYGFISKFTDKCEKEFKEKFKFEDIQAYKNAKAKYENEVLFKQIRDNIYFETHFDIDKLKNSLFENKITNDQYINLVDIYTNTVIVELDNILNSLNTNGENKEKHISEGKIKIDNGPEDKLEQKIKNLTELTSEEKIKTVCEKVLEIRSQLDNRKDIKNKIYKDEDICGNLSKTVSDIINDINKNDTIKVKLSFDTEAACSLKINGLPNQIDISFVKFEDLINEIKKLTGDSDNTAFFIKKNNIILNSRFNIQNNDVLTVVLNKKSKAVNYTGHKSSNKEDGTEDEDITRVDNENEQNTKNNTTDTVVDKKDKDKEPQKYGCGKFSAKNKEKNS